MEWTVFCGRPESVRQAWCPKCSSDRCGSSATAACVHASSSMHTPPHRLASRIMMATVSTFKNFHAGGKKMRPLVRAHGEVVCDCDSYDRFSCRSRVGPRDRIYTRPFGGYRSRLLVTAAHSVQAAALGASA